MAHEFGHVAVLRKRKIPVEGIELFGIHGRTSHGWASATDQVLIAWGGVGVQVVILLVALTIGYTLNLVENPIVWLVAGPIMFVLTKLNIFLMVVALLPIGPFDGHSAWAAIPWLRKTIRRRRRAAKATELFPERNLPAERRRELEESSTKAAMELMEKLGKKDHGRKEDA